MNNTNSPRRTRRNDGYASKILFWEQELKNHQSDVSRYPLSRIEESLAYFKERRAAFLRSQESVNEGKRLFEQLCDERKAQGQEATENDPPRF